MLKLDLEVTWSKPPDLWGVVVVGGWSFLGHLGHPGLEKVWRRFSPLSSIFHGKIHGKTTFCSRECSISSSQMVPVSIQRFGLESFEGPNACGEIAGWGPVLFGLHQSCRSPAFRGCGTDFIDPRVTGGVLVGASRRQLLWGEIISCPLAAGRIHHDQAMAWLVFWVNWEELGAKQRLGVLSFATHEGNYA